MPDPIYLDYNATTPVLPEVLDAMLPYLRDHFGNPSSTHVYGTRTRAAIATARAQVASLIGADPDELLFTSGGTESNNLAIRGVCEAVPEKKHVVTTTIEHPATAKPCQWLQRQGHSVTQIAVDSDGRTDIAQAQSVLTADTALLTVMHSNNETGVLQPITELAALAHRVGVIVHTDAAQSVGKVPINVRELSVDLLSIAGHKLYAPKGIGALYVKRGTPLKPFALGASHERGLRPGTENVAFIVALGAACAIAERDLVAENARIHALRERLFTGLREAIPGLALNGHRELRLPNTLNVRFPNTSGNALLTAAPELAASTGSACHEGHDVASSVIVAMGVSPQEALGSVRITLGRMSTIAEIDLAISALIRAWQTWRACTAE